MMKTEDAKFVAGNLVHLKIISQEDYDQVFSIAEKKDRGEELTNEEKQFLKTFEVKLTKSYNAYFRKKK